MQRSGIDVGGIPPKQTLGHDQIEKSSHTEEGSSPFIFSINHLLYSYRENVVVSAYTSHHPPWEIKKKKTNQQ